MFLRNKALLSHQAILRKNRFIIKVKAGQYARLFHAYAISTILVLAKERL